AKKKKNLLLINHRKYEVGGKVSTLKSTGKPINDSSYPYFALIDLWIEVLGDAPEESPLTPQRWKKTNEIVYNKIPPISSHLCNTKDRQQIKAVLLEMMQLFILHGAQDASMTLFVARAVAIITQNLPIPTSVSKDLVWIQEFQRDTLERTQRPIISCPEITRAPELEVTKEE
ncbi:MAG: hypothetical protein GY861_16780, partial [bacterium]|nr:hypothetical protein [bacterium]